MTGQACPECGGQRPGCACARAELAAAEDFDPLRIRPYVTLDAQEESGGGADRLDGAGAQDGAGALGGSGGLGGPSGLGGAELGEAGDGGDPPTTQLRAIRAGAAGFGDGHGEADAPYGPPSHESPSYGSAPYE
ncbi:hypothetical protein ACWGDD_23245, partial [Streptomyces sp. NPDC055011]